MNKLPNTKKTKSTKRSEALLLYCFVFPESPFLLVFGKSAWPKQLSPPVKAVDKDKLLERTDRPFQHRLLAHA